MSGVTVAAIRTHHHREFRAAALVAAKAGRRVSLCLPARDEEATVGAVVATAVRDLVERQPLLDEVLVLDDGSTDATAEVAAAAGARVVRGAEVLPEAGAGSGKGDAMWRSLAASTGDVVVWCDADIRDFGPRFVVGLLGPLLLDDGVDFVKGFYERSLHGRPGEGGRVTELVARPLLELLHPPLAAFAQPLAGEYAGRREVLEQVPFVQGYGVEVGLLVDVARLVGLERMAQVDLGTRVHRNRPLPQLAPQARVVMQAALTRAGVTLAEPPGERPPLATVATYRRRSA